MRKSPFTRVLPETLSAGWRCTKRDGTLVNFDCGKIRKAVANCFATTYYDGSAPDTQEVVTQVEDVTSGAIMDLAARGLTQPTVEDIQRYVIKQLWKKDLFAAAESYQNYREEHRKQRDLETAAVFGTRTEFKPFEYPDAEQFKLAIQRSPWIVEEFDFTSDTQDFRVHLLPAERSAVSRTLLAISQVEVKVKRFWTNLGTRLRRPEFDQVGAVFGANEVVHQDAYSRILDVLALSDAFKGVTQVPAVKQRIDYLDKAIRSGASGTDKGFAKALTVFALLVENVSLFSQFVIVKSFSRKKGAMQNVDNVVQATMKEECHAAGTEILTPSGWVDLRDVAVGDDVIEYDNGALRPTKVLHKTDRAYAGNMYHFHNHSIDCLVTPQHDMVYYVPSGEMRKRKAQDFRPHSKQRVPYGGRLESTPGPGMSAEERLRVAIQADGSTMRWTTKGGTKKLRGDSGGATHVFSLTKERKKKRLEALLAECGVSYTKHAGDVGEDVYRISYNQDYDYKSFAWVRLETRSAEWLEEFVMETTHWDGFKDAEADAWGYSSTNKDNIDVVHAAAVMAGFRTGLYRREDTRSSTYKDCYKVMFRRRELKVTAHGIHRDVVPYDGTVHCVTVQSGAIVTRRNDKVFVAGNCVHAMFGAWLVNLIKAERPEWFDGAFYDDLRATCLQAFDAENAILDWVFEDGQVSPVSRAGLTAFLQDRVNQGVAMIGSDPIFKIDLATLAETAWFYEELKIPIDVDFFHKRSTNYSTPNKAVTAADMW
jgi:ribonucleotide reductase beta subunit family protein with ferritin-like domain